MGGNAGHFSLAPRRRQQGNVIHFETPGGSFAVQLDARRAPVTSQYFKDIVAAGLYCGSSIYRITTPENDIRHSDCPIRIIQGGLKFSQAQQVAPVALEPTCSSGLRHKRWAFSTARFAENRPYGAFFICMEDSPCLDSGGRRSEDSLGFAACGAVVAGFSTLEAIYACAGSTDFLQREIPITSASLSHE